MTVVVHNVCCHLDGSNDSRCAGSRFAKGHPRALHNFVAIWPVFGLRIFEFLHFCKMFVSSPASLSQGPDADAMPMEYHYHATWFSWVEELPLRNLGVVLTPGHFKVLPL